MRVLHFSLIAAALAAGVVIAGSASKDAPVPAGTYVGTGDWKGMGSTGRYDAKTTIADGVWTSHYAYQDGGGSHQETVKMTLQRTTDPYFDVLDDKGQKVGSGYCYDAECSYRAAFGGIEVSETLRYTDGKIHKLGSKSGPGFAVVWKEVLEAE